MIDPNRQIYIAEYRGEPIGTVRADKVDSGWQLSWTVAPEFRERGLGIQMVRLLAASISGSIEAVIKPGNAASITIAESLGMRFDKEENGILRFFRGPRTAGCAASESTQPMVAEPLAIEAAIPSGRRRCAMPDSRWMTTTSVRWKLSCGATG